MELNDRQQLILNKYFKELERHLEAIGAGDRAEIILELQGHILESLEKGDRDLEEILASLGTAKQVASRYLIERGHSPVFHKKKAHVFWWVFGGISSAFVLVVILAVLLFQALTPLIQYDDRTGHLSILGGMIEVNEHEDQVSLGKGLINIHSDDIDIDVEGTEYNGSFSRENLKLLKVNALNASLEFETTRQDSISYECELFRVGEDFPVSAIQQEEESVLAFNFRDAVGAVSCEFQLPEGLAYEVDVTNGKVELNEPLQDVKVELGNGKLEFEPYPNQAYSVRSEVKLGSVHGPSLESTKPEAYRIDLSVLNGSIEIND